MLRTELRTLQLRDLTQLGPEVGQKNARSMSPATYKRLVDNIRQDGVLTSTPLVGPMQGDDRIFVLSGNHRIAAAIDAGIEEAACITILDPIPRDRFSAIQLSHNAIEGDDDASILQELYGILDLDLKMYSGLTDDDFQNEDLSVLTLAANAPLYIEVVFGFLADDARAVEEFLKSAGRWEKKKTPAYFAPYVEFERFFEALVRAKGLKGITNSAIAMSALVELANERMDELEAEATPAKRPARR